MGGNREREEKGEEAIRENIMEIAHGGVGIGMKNREIKGNEEIDEADLRGKWKKEGTVGEGRLGITGVHATDADRQSKQRAPSERNKKGDGGGKD